MDIRLIDKIKFYFTENLFRLGFVAALVGFIGVFVYALQIERNNRPPADLMLPNGVAVSGRPAIQGGDNASLTIQNHSSPEVAQMLLDMIAESLSFTGATYDRNIAAVEPYFTPSGYRQYKEFLAGSGFAQTLSQQNLQAGAYIQGAPLEINRGAYNGAFKWVFEVPVTISFVPTQFNTYRGDTVRAQNRKIVLRVQLTRVADPRNPDAVRIEIWQAKPV